MRKSEKSRREIEFPCLVMSVAGVNLGIALSLGYDSLRCDRKDPCAACVQRGDPEGCRFTEPLSSQPYLPL